MTDTAAAQFDPADHTVDETLDYLAALPDEDADARDAEFARVVAAERAGKNRSTLLSVIEGTPSPVDEDTQPGVVEHADGTVETGTVTDQPDARDETGRPLSTKALTFADAAEDAIVDERTVGTSPEAERTGRRDKGLSQRNPAILNGGPIPDPRHGVDDSAGLAALADLEG